MTTTHPRPTRLRVSAAALAAIAAGTLFAACGGGGSGGSNANGPNTPAATSAKGAANKASPGSQVLPVTTNPISNSATDATLKIDSVLVENNVDASGKAAEDHLEIAVSNTATADLSGFEVFYTIKDATAGSAESYYSRIPDSFTVPSGGTRIIHFDNTGAADHFPVNQYNLYYSSTNALDVTVEVSAKGAAPQTTTVQKDAGGAEVPD